LKKTRAWEKAWGKREKTWNAKFVSTETGRGKKNGTGGLRRKNRGGDGCRGGKGHKNREASGRKMDIKQLSNSGTDGRIGQKGGGYKEQKRTVRLGLFPLTKKLCVKKKTLGLRGEGRTNGCLAVASSQDKMVCGGGPGAPCSDGIDAWSVQKDRESPPPGRGKKNKKWIGTDHKVLSTLCRQTGPRNL